MPPVGNSGLKEDLPQEQAAFDCLSMHAACRAVTPDMCNMMTQQHDVSGGMLWMTTVASQKAGLVQHQCGVRQ